MSAEDFEDYAVTAKRIADERGFDETVIARAVEFARRDLETGRETSPFVALIVDFATTDERAIIATRLGEHVSRRTARNADVRGLFDAREG